MAWKNPFDKFWTCSVEPMIFLLYFLVQTGQGLPWTALSYLLTTEVKVPYEKMNDYYAICYIPWSFKLVFGYISDSLPIMGRRRIPYFVFYSILVTIAFFAYGLAVKSYTSALVCGVILNTCQCGAQVIIDTLVVERVHKETDDEGNGQSLAMTAKTAGTAFSTILSLILLIPKFRIPYRWFFFFSGIPYLIAAICAFKIKDATINKYSFKETIVDGVNLIFCGRRGNSEFSKNNKPLFPLLLLLIIRSLVPSTTTNIYSFFSGAVGLEAWKFNTLNICTSLASLLGSIIYHKAFVGKNLAKVIVYTTIAAAITSLLQVFFVSGIIENVNVLLWVTILIMSINSMASQIAFIPMLIMVSRVCPVGYEASMWAVFFSLNDIAGTLGGKITTWITSLYGISYMDYSNLHKMVTLCSLLSLVPLLYVLLIRDYFSIAAAMIEPTAEVRGGLSLMVYDK